MRIKPKRPGFDHLVVMQPGIASEVYGVSLTARPSAPVRVYISSRSHTVKLHPSTLLFGPNDWNREHAVHVAALPSHSVHAKRSGTGVVEIGHRARSADARYDLAVAKLDVHIVYTVTPWYVSRSAVAWRRAASAVDAPPRPTPPPHRPVPLPGWPRSGQERTARSESTRCSCGT